MSTAITLAILSTACAVQSMIIVILVQRVNKLADAIAHLADSQRAGTDAWASFMRWTFAHSDQQQPDWRQDQCS